MINEHDEDDDGAKEELYLVTAGWARFELDGESVDAPAGTFVFARAAVTRTAFAEEAGTTMSPWVPRPARRTRRSAGRSGRRSGRSTRAAITPASSHGSVLIVDEHPQYALLLFNLACCEAQIGDSAEAIDHLRRSIELSAQFLAYARDDSDLDPIRDEPGFKELVGDQD